MIKSFRHKGLKKLYERGDRSLIRADMLETILERLARLDIATDPDVLNLPAYHLHALKGDLKGYWAITVRANWRIIFRFDGGHVADIELIDYH